MPAWRGPPARLPDRARSLRGSSRSVRATRRRPLSERCSWKRSMRVPTRGLHRERRGRAPSSPAKHRTALSDCVCLGPAISDARPRGRSGCSGSRPRFSAGRTHPSLHIGAVPVQRSCHKLPHSSIRAAGDIQACPALNRDLEPCRRDGPGPRGPRSPGWRRSRRSSCR